MPNQLLPDSEPTGVLLVTYASRLGVSPDVVRMRLKRGKIEGFLRDGRRYVYPNTGGEQANEHVGKQSEQANDGAGEALTLELRHQVRRLEAQNDGLVAEMRDVRQGRDELERRLTSLMQQQQQALADMNGRLALPAPAPAESTNGVLASIAKALRPLYRRGQT